MDMSPEDKTAPKPGNGGAAKLDLQQLMDFVKAIAFIGGGLGSLTILFYWIGNAIIVARLRVYNLYGAVHYTEEYVREAGYQFFQDLFTFFTRWQLGLVFLLALMLVFLFIPVGPYRKSTDAPAEEPSATRSGGPMGEFRSVWRRLTQIDKKWRYPLFAAMAIGAAGMLTSDVIVRNLSRNIIHRERVLKSAQQLLSGDADLLFQARSVPAPGGYRAIFRDNLYDAVMPTRYCLESKLAEIYPDFNPQELPSYVQRFQHDIGIDTDSDFLSDWFRFGSSATYQALENIQVNQDLIRQFTEMVSTAYHSIRTNLSGHFSQEADASALVISPAILDEVNHELIALMNFTDNVSYFFVGTNDQTRTLMKALGEIEPIHFAGAALTFSFWILIGLLIYFLLNAIRIMQFKRWEQVYFLFMLLLFFIIAVAIPTLYGRYKFEFNVQKLENYSAPLPETLVAGKRPDGSRPSVSMYVLGPTRGKEIIVATLDLAEAVEDRIRIMIVDKDTIQMQVLKPAAPVEIPLLINMLRSGMNANR